MSAYPFKISREKWLPTLDSGIILHKWLEIVKIIYAAESWDEGVLRTF